MLFMALSTAISIIMFVAISVMEVEQLFVVVYVVISAAVFAVVSALDMEQLYVVMSTATSAVVYAVVYVAVSAVACAEILVELSLERYAVGISHQAQLVLKS